MTVQEFAAAQAAISLAAVEAVVYLARAFRSSRMSVPSWHRFLALIFPYIADARRQSAALGRRFYDEQRAQHHPDLPRHDTFLAEYHLEWFIQDMVPVAEDFMKPGASEVDVEQVALRALRSVENGGRRTILRAVQTDPVDSKGVRWARVATGRETCGFCMMLVSRGPTYLSAEGAGLNLNDTSAIDLWLAVENASTDSERKEAEKEFDGMMTKWHTGCDCKVVPVFDRADWPGRDAYLRAQRLWRKHAKGKGREAMNAFRRAIDAGEVDVTEMSIAA